MTAPVAYLTIQIHADRFDEGNPVADTRRVLTVTQDAWEQARLTDASKMGDALEAPWGWVTCADLATGEVLQIAVAPCGTGCRCAAAWRPLSEAPYTGA